jgi:hypothetical protein
MNDDPDMPLQEDLQDALVGFLVTRAQHERLDTAPALRRAIAGFWQIVRMGNRDLLRQYIAVTRQAEPCSPKVAGFAVGSSSGGGSKKPNVSKH